MCKNVFIYNLMPVWDSLELDVGSKCPGLEMLANIDVNLISSNCHFMTTQSISKYQYFSLVISECSDGD